MTEAGRPLSSRGERVGVYPGSFNPPTVAHQAIAEAARRRHGLTRVDLTVSRSALAKENVAHPRFDHRIEVLRAAVAGIDWLAVCVTDDQLLADVAAGYDLLIVGADKWWQIQDPAWYGGDERARDEALARLPAVAVAPRAGYEVPAGLALDLGDAELAHVSSTEARAGRLDLMVPAARRFSERTGAWVDEPRYERWLRSHRSSGGPQPHG